MNDDDWTGPARHDLRRLGQDDARRVARAVEHFARTGQGDVRHLEGREGEWRLRVGDVRVIFRYDRQRRRLIVLRVQPRGRAYRQ